MPKGGLILDYTTIPFQKRKRHLNKTCISTNYAGMAVVFIFDSASYDLLQNTDLNCSFMFFSLLPFWAAIGIFFLFHILILSIFKENMRLMEKCLLFCSTNPRGKIKLLFLLLFLHLPAQSALIFIKSMQSPVPSDFEN
jgi:hypothetical protein